MIPARSVRTPLRRSLSALGLLAALSVVAAGVVLAGCGTGKHARHAADGDDERPLKKRPPRDDAENDIVSFEQPLDQDAPGLLSEFETRAKRHGCETSSQPTNVVAKCSEGPIVLVKEGTRVTVACKAMTLDACKRLFQRIADAKEGSAPGRCPKGTELCD